jgi:hypothetical protein
MRLPLILALAAAVAAGLPAPGSASGVKVVARDEAIGAVRTPQAGSRTLAARRAPRPFNLVGLHWRGGGSVRFRTGDASGRWSPWRGAQPEGEDAPDRASRERRLRAGWRVGNPYWTGPSTVIQYRLSGTVSRLRSFFVWSPLRPGRRLTIAGTPQVIPRASWGADEAIVRAKPQYANALAFAVVHHTAGQSPATPQESAAIVRAIQAYHVKGNGWNDIGYNFLVDPFGQVFEGRGGGVDRAVVGAHAEGFNTGSVGIALLGTYEGGEPSEAAKASVAALIAWRFDLAHIDPLSFVSHLSAGNSRFARGVPVSLAAVSGHRDTGFTSCPGNALYARLPEIAQRVAALGLPKLYEPRVSGAIGGVVTFTARLSEAIPWTITVTDLAGATVAGSSGVGPEIAWSWDTSTLSSAAGTYAYRIDAGPATLPAYGTIGEQSALDLQGLRVDPAVLVPTPDAAAEATIGFVLGFPATLSVSVLDAASAQVATLLPETAYPPGPVSVRWNALLPDGARVPDGRYRIGVRARSSTQDVYRSVEVVVDSTLSGLSLTRSAVSPNGDGRLDSLGVAFDLTRPAAVRVRILAGEKSIARVFAGSLAAGARQIVTWNGRKRTGRVRDGSYAAVIDATTDLGKRELRQPFTIDSTSPRVTILSARTRRGATKVLLSLSEPARLKVWYDRASFSVDRPRGTTGFWQRLAPRRVRIVAWDTAGNASPPATLRLTDGRRKREQAGR